MNVKQVIIIRRDLKMGRGKTASQAAHASMKFLTDGMSFRGGEASILLDDDLTDWLGNSFTKICLYVDSEEELDMVYQVARDAGLRVSMIEDNGTTEFNGVKTKTCIAIGPNKVDEINIVTGHLKLL